MILRIQSNVNSHLNFLVDNLSNQEGGNPRAPGWTSSSGSGPQLLELRPGSLRSFVEFHPLIILYITTKITQKTTNFNGINKLIQSILPSLSTCNYRFFQNTRASSVSQLDIQEIKWRKTAIRPWSIHPGAPCGLTA